MGLTKYTPRKLRAVLMFGQSNEGDGVAGTHSAAYTGYQNTYTFFKPDSSATNNGVIENLKYGRNNNWNAAHLNWACPQASFGYQFYQDTKQPLLIIRYAQGGSALVDDGTVATNGLWQIDANPTNASGLLHYSIAMNNFVIPAIQLVQSMRIELDIVAGFWCQGEADAQTLFRATHYEAELIRFWDAVKATIQPYGVLNANFKPIITRIHNNFNPVRDYAGTVRTAQENVAAHYNSQWINSDAYALYTDFTHWTAAGQESHGLDRNTALKTHLGL